MQENINGMHVYILLLNVSSCLQSKDFRPIRCNFVMIERQG